MSKCRKVTSVDVRQKRRGTTLEGYTGGLQEYVNKKSATGVGDEAVTQKRKKSSEHPKQDMDGSEVQKMGRP